MATNKREQADGAIRKGHAGIPGEDEDVEAHRANADHRVVADGGPEGALNKKAIGAIPGQDDDVEGHRANADHRVVADGGPEGALNKKAIGAVPGEDDDVEGHSFNRRGGGGELTGDRQPTDSPRGEGLNAKNRW
jgi:hypothetical protein